MRFWIYAGRWQLSSLILAPCIYLFSYNAIIAAVVSNFVGACIFYWVDRLIFKNQSNQKN